MFQYRGSVARPPPTSSSSSPPPPPSQLLPTWIYLVNNGGLHKMLDLALTRLETATKPSRVCVVNNSEEGEEDITPMTTTTDGIMETPPKANEELCTAWLKTLKTDLTIPDMARAFVLDRDALLLLLRAAGAPTASLLRRGVDPILLADPLGASLRPFKQAFSISANARCQALEVGVIDRLLMRLGELQSEEPRNAARPSRFVLHEPIMKKNLAIAGGSGSSTTAITLSATTKSDNKITSNTTNSTEQLSTVKYLWKPGYGAGETSVTALKHVLLNENLQKMKREMTLNTLNTLLTYLESLEPNDLTPSQWNDLLAALDSSCLLKVFLSNLLCLTIKGLLESVRLVTALLKVILAITKHPQRLAVQLLLPVPGMYKSVIELIEELYGVTSDEADQDDDDMVLKEIKALVQQVWFAVRLIRSVLVTPVHGGGDSDTRDEEEQIKQTETNSDLVVVGAATPNNNDTTTPQSRYVAEMRTELFRDMDMRDSETGMYKYHHYQTAIEEDAKAAVSKGRHRRLNRELKSLRTTLPLDFGSCILFRVDRTRPFVAQAMIFAPSSTPYDSGAFLFDIFCTSEYPQDPPKVNLQTTGEGKVRFSPNLYINGKVCLSLLGTWNGGATGSENWDPDKSSLYQVLVSIQSAILGSEFPHFNEPMAETLWGTPEGDLQKRINPNGGYERLRVATIQHAMTGQLRNPPTGFEHAIKTHFRIKQGYIRKVCLEWLEEAKKSDTAGHLQALTEAIADLEKELKELGGDDDVQQQQQQMLKPPPLTEEELSWTIAADIREKVFNESIFLMDMFIYETQKSCLEALRETGTMQGTVLIATDLGKATDWLTAASMAKGAT